MHRIDGLEFVEETTWTNVWEQWAADESNDPGWKRVAKDKGWNNWEEWREAWVANFQAKTRKWLLHKIEDPLAFVPNLLIGPAQGWQNRFPEPERIVYTFADLVKKFHFDENQKIQAILNNFPKKTQLIGLVKPGGKIVCIEGHHRATALALLASRQETRKIEPAITIALACLETGEGPLLDKMLARGSHKIG